MALSLIHILHNNTEGRILYPMKRSDWDPKGERHPENRGKSAFERISWDEALDIIADECFRIKEAYGPEAIITGQGTGLTTVLNAMIPDLMSGMGNPPLTLFMLGPSLATIFAFIGSLVATQLLEKLTPKWSLLLGTLVVTLMLVIFAMTSSVYWWIFANALNGVVLSFGAHAAASAVTAKFWGGRTQSVYGVISGAYSLLVAAEVFLVAFLMSVTDYRTVLWIFAGLSLGIGVFSNLVLIGRVPKHAPDEGEAAKERCV